MNACVPEKLVLDILYNAIAMGLFTLSILSTILLIEIYYLPGNIKKSLVARKLKKIGLSDIEINSYLRITDYLLADKENFSNRLLRILFKISKLG